MHTSIHAAETSQP